MSSSARSSFDIPSVFGHDFHRQPGGALKYFVDLWSAFRCIEEIQTVDRGSCTERFKYGPAAFDGVRGPVTPRRQEVPLTLSGWASPLA